MSRRRFLLASTLGGLSLAAYSAYRGIRFPRLSFEPHALPNEFDLASVRAKTQDLIRTPSLNSIPRFRAYAPEPKIHLSGPANSVVKLELTNIAEDAQLQGDLNSVSEHQIIGITRHLSIRLPFSGEVSLHWQLPIASAYEFAVIGDTGGDQELAWCLQRAADLGARFMLHLGDFYYQEGDYERAISHFDNAALPVYVSIGNHDFHDSGLLYDRFRENIGPFNHSFVLGKTRFTNLDTAANTLPFGAGHRGDLLEKLSLESTEIADNVAFTHRPLYDPSEDDDHDMGSDGERDWLIAALKKVGIGTLLSGHIHIYHRGRFDGIENIIVGQGLGHQDLIVNRDYSKMLVGTVAVSGQVSYRTMPLAMPMEMHCHPRSDVVKQSLLDAEHYPVIEAIDRSCEDPDDQESRNL